VVHLERNAVDCGVCAANTTAADDDPTANAAANDHTTAYDDTTASRTFLNRLFDRISWRFPHPATAADNNTAANNTAADHHTTTTTANNTAANNHTTAYDGTAAYDDTAANNHAARRPHPGKPSTESDGNQCHGRVAYIVLAATTDRHTAVYLRRAVSCDRTAELDSVWR
jgi:hypothetical protein